MEGATRKRWNTLCEQAAVENDPVKASRLFTVWAKEHKLGWQSTIEQTEEEKVM